jgi:DNA-binding IclR family transcriptional regulator
VVDILELLAASRDGLVLRDVSGRLEAPKSSLLPLPARAHGARLSRPGACRRVPAGAGAMDLGGAAPGPAALLDSARPAVVDLMRRTGETVFVGTLFRDHASIVYVDKVESDHIIQYAGGVGDRRPLHATSIGKAILAFLPAAELTSVSGAKFRAIEKVVTRYRGSKF